MENAKTMREIALAAVREKTAKELADATELIEGTLSSIFMKSANEGQLETIVHIPVNYNIFFIIQILEEHGYKISDTQKHRNYLVKW